MSDIAHAGRIPEPAFKACLGLFLGLSALAVAARTVIRIKTFRGLHADDAFLFFGLICMAITTGLGYPIVSIVYLEEAITLEPGRYTLPQNDLQTLLRDDEIIDVFVVFAWTAEFSVKMSLLLFFRLLVKRLRPLTLYVRIVIGFTALVWAVLVCEPFLTCPHFGASILTKCVPSNVPLTVGLTILIVVLDILTDLMILSIPVIILWKSSMSINQKLGIGAFLTMNIWLIIIALVRVTLFKRGNTFDLTWTLFFQFFEPNVAILAACFSAFRSLYATNSSKRHMQHRRPPYSFSKRLFKKVIADEQQLENLPSIPGPTLKGMRTMIWKNDRSQYIDSTFNNSTLDGPQEQFTDDVMPLGGSNDRRNKIVVRHDWSLESTRVDSNHDGALDRQFV